MTKLDAPFLELAFCLARNDVKHAVQLLTTPAQEVPVDKLRLSGAVGLLKKAEELQVYGRIVVLRTEAENFCGPMRDNVARLRKLGRKVYERFVEVADTIPCIYGAILIEFSLEEPESLVPPAESLSFRDFFLSSKHFDGKDLNAVRRIVGERGYIEERKRGVYVSMSAEFNPDGASIPSVESQYKSLQIGQLVGRLLG